MMQQRMPWEEDWSQSQSGPATGYPTITMRRDPLAVRRDQRAEDAAVRSADAADRASRNEQRRINMDARREAEQRDQKLDPASATYYAQQVLSGAPLPSLGMGATAAANRIMILNQVARLAGANGLTGADLATQIAHYKAGSAAIRKLETDAGTIGQNEQTALANGQQFLDRSREMVGQTSITPINALSNGIQRMFGGKTIAAMDAAYNTFYTEYAKVVAGSPSGAGTLSDSARHEAMETIRSNASLAQKQAAFDQMKTDMANRMAAIHGGINNAYKALARMPGYDVPDDMQHLDAPGPRAGSGGLGGGFASPPPATPIAGGGTKLDRDPEREKALDGLIRSGADMETLNAKSREMGGLDLDPKQVDVWRTFYAKNPGYGGSSVDTSVAVPTTAWNRFAASPVGTGIYAAVDAGLGGMTDEIASSLGGGDLADLNARKQAAFVANPTSAFLGQVGGTVASMYGLGKLGGAVGLSSKFSNPALAGDLAFGGLSGVGQSNDNRLLGGTLGTLGGLAGNYVGGVASNVVGAAVRTRPGLAVVNGTARMFGRGPIARVAPLSRADTAVLGAIDRAGLDTVTPRLTEAQDLGLPMSLADTDPNLRELAGAATRRSPTASTFAENALIPRNRGQYDRFTNAVGRELGPIANVREVSADLSSQARTAAGDLYDRAYARSVPTTPELDAVLATPFGRQAVGRARTIAANERRSPEELGFALDASGSPVLNPRPNDVIARHLGARAELDDAQAAYRTAREQPGANVGAARDRMLSAREKLRQAQVALAAAPDPSLPASVPAFTTQTLDYVKRGMDDVLEEQRNQLTGRLHLDEAGRAQNNVRGQLLTEVDRLNPEFADARKAYAGPAASRDALVRGTEAYTLHPDDLSIQVAGQTPEHLSQMQLGYRSELVDHAGRVRDASNPWEATLGSPVARDRLGTMYPNNPGVDRLYRARAIESDMQQTTNAILGNSRTARNQIADQAFVNSPLVEAAMHAGAAVATHGASLPGTAARVAGSTLSGRLTGGLKGLLQRTATADADAMIPTLTTTDPAATLAIVQGLVGNRDARRAFIEASRPRLGMFGRGFGSQLAVAPLNR